MKFLSALFLTIFLLAVGPFSPSPDSLHVSHIYTVSVNTTDYQIRCFKTIFLKVFIFQSSFVDVENLMVL